MKQVFEQYASAVISVIVASAVLAIWLGTFYLNQNGLGQSLGVVLGHSLKTDEFFEQVENAFDSYMDGAAPVISVKDNYSLVKGVRTPVSQCFQAVSDSGSLLPMYVDKGWLFNGEEIDVGLSEDQSSICISEAGAYWISAYAIDEKGKEQRILVKLLVNER